MSVLLDPPVRFSVSTIVPKALSAFRTDGVGQRELFAHFRDIRQPRRNDHIARMDPIFDIVVEGAMRLVRGVIDEEWLRGIGLDERLELGQRDDLLEAEHALRGAT